MTTQRRTFLDMALLGPACACLLLGCAPVESEGPVGLVVATSTDLQVPKDITHVGMVVTHEGRQKLANWYEIGPEGLRLPATLVIEPGLNDDPVTIQLFARRGLEVLSLREAVVPVPRDRLAMLPLRVEWLSLGMVENLPAEEDEDTEGDASLPGFEPSFELTVSTCPEGETPVAGTCSPAELSPSTLPAYQDGLVFGGGDPGGTNGTCFDTPACFAEPRTVTIVDRAKCVGATPGPYDPERVSIGLVPADGAGICGAAGCIVPLDRVSLGAFEPGWMYPPTAQNTLVLPPAVCEKLDEGVIRAVVASTTCWSKTPSVPTCGPWSSVGTATESDTPNLQEKCRRFVDRACDGIRRCRGSRGWLRGVVDDEGTCSERLAYLCDPSLLVESAGAWQTFFDDCRAAWETEDCSDQQQAVRRACREPVASGGEALGTGQPCSFGECGKGELCLGALPTGCGTCQPRYEEASGVPCGMGSALDVILPGGACAKGLGCRASELSCAPYGGEGEGCKESDDCDSGLVCVDEVCQPARGKGARCAADSACAPGLHCIGDGDSGWCRGPRKEDESCAVVGSGEALWDENLCNLAAGLRCDPETMTCRPTEVVETGAECSTLSQCDDGFCSGVEGGDGPWTCRAFVKDGEPCSLEGTRCEPPAQCISGLCRIRPLFGRCGVTMVDVPGMDPDCPDGQAACSGVCTNLKNDARNCGVCGLVCPSGLCDGGSCQCPSGLSQCGTDCVDTYWDVDHCGVCFNACPEGATCEGTCLCPVGQLDCQGVCTDVLFDSANCGDCNSSCDGECFNGSCVIAGTGGAGTGGAGTGGSVATGGVPATGGSGETGGGVSVGGTDTGGATGVGGVSGTGGAGGAPAGGGTGGTTGGTAGVGGTGGTAGTGGATGGIAPGGAGGIWPWDACVAGMPSTFVVNGYGTAGAWNGHVYNSADLAAEVVPDCDTGNCYEDQGPGFCAAATVDANYTAFLELGFNLNQVVGGEPQPWPLEGSGISVSLGCAMADELRIELNGEESSNPDQIYCAPLNQDGTIDWTEFTTYCWAEEGTPEYDLRSPLTLGTPIYAVNIIAPGSGAPQLVTICVESIELVP